jgi:hypothetical protein
MKKILFIVALIVIAIVAFNTGTWFSFITLIIYLIKFFIGLSIILLLAVIVYLYTLYSFLK